MKKLFILVLIGLFLSPCMNISLSQAADKTSEQKKEAKNKKEADKERKEIRAMRSKTLTELYKKQPKAKAVLANSAGYGVFDLFAMKLGVMGTTRGNGIVINNTGKKETFMKMMRVGAGLGLGIDDFRSVFVFKTKKSIDDFVNQGMELDAKAGAAAKYDKKGDALEGAIAISSDIVVYQLTQKGLSMGVMVGGTKYWKDDDLN